MSERVILALGGNMVGPWGTPAATLARAIDLLSKTDVKVRAVSRLFETVPVGQAGQPNYLNCVVAGCTRLAPRILLARLKGLERKAGRYRGLRWGARTLDIDIIDYGGATQGHPSMRIAGGLVLPHPEMHRRPFVVIPLAEVAPCWRHPRSHHSIGLLRRQMMQRGEGQVIAPVEAPEWPFAEAASFQRGGCG